MTTTNHS